TARLRVSHAFHSHRMEPMLEELAAVAAGLELSAPAIPVVSDVSGELLDAEALTAALAQSHVAGVELDWGAFFGGSGAGRVELPTYAFQRERYWIEPGVAAGDPAGAGQAAASHPLLGAEVQLADSGERLF